MSRIGLNIQSLDTLAINTQLGLIDNRIQNLTGAGLLQVGPTSINAAGNVGIGGAPGTSPLTVTLASFVTPQLVVQHDPSSVVRLMHNGGLGAVGTSTNHDFVIQTNSITAIDIDTFQVAIFVHPIVLQSLGGANHFIKQSSLGAPLTSGTIGAGDVPDAALTTNVALLNRTAQNFTGSYNRFVQVGIGTAPGAGRLFEALAVSQDSYFRSASSTGYSRLFIENDAATGGITTIIYGSAFAGTSPYGSLPYANLQAITSHAANGFVIGTTPTQPLVFATHDLERMRIDGSGNVVLNSSGSALVTTATDGFTYLPSCAGTPTGVPTGFTGAVPMVVDTTGVKIWFRIGGAWKGVAVA